MSSMSEPVEPFPVRRAHRDPDDRVVGGVAAGLAHHLAVSVVWVRIGFVVTALLGGLGIAFYAGLWVMLPAAPPRPRTSPGLDSAERGGRRPGPRTTVRDTGPAVALGAIAIGAVLLLTGGGSWLWPVGIGLVGVGLFWRQADEAQRERWLDATGGIDLPRVVIGRGGWAAYARLLVGAVLLVGALVLFALRGGSWSLARDITVATLLGVAGILVVAGPWVYRLVVELADERAERIRTQERADVAAHLHDSVLQTLALIQKNPSDAGRLARAQERDLRTWLYAGEPADDRAVASALRTVAGEVEDRWAVAVDVVAVGDRPVTEREAALVAAAGEAMTNAAKHAGVDRIDVYAEITGETIEVFVRDRGRGFDPEALPADRWGVRGSILARMARHDGTATIRSAPGAGTEVRLAMTDSSEQTGGIEQ